VRGLNAAGVDLEWVGYPDHHTLHARYCCCDAQKV